MDVLASAAGNTDPQELARRLQRLEELERIVAERSAELAWTNERLVAEIYDRNAAEAAAERLEHFDAVTGLPNRRLLEARIDRALPVHQACGEPLAVVIVGLLRLPQLRESFGLAAGDDAARVVADRLRSTLRGSDALARVGDNEFAVMLSHLRHAEDATHVARKLFDALDAPLRICGCELRLAPCVGLAVYPDDGAGADLLLARAAAAMQYACENGATLYQFFRPDIASRVSRRLHVEAELRAALEADDFHVFYQPRVDVKTGRVIGAEALVRWQHPQRGLLTPCEFLDVAEETGLIVPIGERVLRKACAEATGWPRAVSLSVNLSPREFRGQSMLTGVEDALRATGLAPPRLQIEISEVGLQRGFDETDADALQGLRSLGVHVVLDNFGAGSGSLEVLRVLPVDSLKIDGQFVRHATSNRRDALIVTALAKLGKDLRLRVIAEGVETREQLAFVRKLGCAEAQGFFLGRPMSARDFEQRGTQAPAAPRKPRVRRVAAA
ncbi:MAG TPA: EAL domain-containing protein [Burkholderiaceae bacterium]|nr:EAL domain-containing protein [Burkholderiaceae bacterium]